MRNKAGMVKITQFCVEFIGNQNTIQYPLIWLFYEPKGWRRHLGYILSYSFKLGLPHRLTFTLLGKN